MNAVPDAALLHHIIVVGGTVAEWRGLGDDAWTVRLNELGKVADHVGAQWLTLRPYSAGPHAAVVPAAPERSATVGNCLVSAQPEADGRARVAAVVKALHADGVDVTEASIAQRLNAPAEADPDLVVVLGESHHLPPSLVWELAYSELVFIPTEWSQLGAGHLDDAINAFAQRQRRFGGVND